MSQDTPGTRPDPETEADGTGNQLPKEDTLVNRGLEDPLDEGYSPPERPSPASTETASEQNEPDTISERETQENPEIWEAENSTDPVTGEPADPDKSGPKEDPERTGRLTAPPDAATDHEQDVEVEDAGIAGGAAGAEEAAMHLEDDPYTDRKIIESDDVADDD